LRPAVVWLAHPAYAVTGSAAQAFDVTTMSSPAAGVSVFAVDGVVRRVGARAVDGDRLHQPVERLSSAGVLPVLIDLGGHAMMALAIWFIIAGPRWAAGAAWIAGVLSREYAPVVLIFGAWRDRRLQVPLNGAPIGGRRADAGHANAISGNGPDAILYGVVSLLRLDQCGAR
jgi:hypothetical protein